MTAKLTNYDASGNRWSADRTIRVIPQYDRDVLARQPWTNPRLRPWRYEINDTLTGEFRYAMNLNQARIEVAAILRNRPTVEWQEWETFGDGWRCFTRDGMVEVRVGRSQDANHSGLYGVAILGCGPVRSWLSDIRHPQARRDSLIARANALIAREVAR